MDRDTQSALNVALNDALSVFLDRINADDLPTLADIHAALDDTKADAETLLEEAGQ